MPQPPSGTVTFLFTDIEGSTHLWESVPDAMRLALERHDVLVRTAIEVNSGYVVKTTGDGVHATFGRAGDALAAAVAMQAALGAEPWPDGATVRRCECVSVSTRVRRRNATATISVRR